MQAGISKAQARALEIVSKGNQYVGKQAEERTLRSLEVAKLIIYSGDQWRLTGGGKMMTQLLREREPTLEFLPLIEKRKQMQARTRVGEHSVHGHDLVYIAEKIRLIFGQYITDANEEARAAFLSTLVP